MRDAFAPEPYTVGEIRALRDNGSHSLRGALEEMERRTVLASLDKLEAEGTLEDKVNWLLTRFRENIDPDSRRISRA